MAKTRTTPRWAGYVRYYNGRYWTPDIPVEVPASSYWTAANRAAEQGKANALPCHRRGFSKGIALRLERVTPTPTT